MGFLSRLFGGARTPADSGAVLWLYVRCNRCRETIRVRVNRNTDVAPEYDENGHTTYGLLRKEILGNRCPALMSVELHLDGSGRTIEQQAMGCAIINEAEYEEGQREAASRPGPPLP